MSIFVTDDPEKAGVMGKLFSVEDKAKKDEEARASKVPAGTQPTAGMKKGGSVKGWGMARGARKAKTY